MYIFREANRARDASKSVDVRDEEGARVITGRRELTRQPVSEPVLRREVSRNVHTLLNTVHLAATEDLTPFENVQRSIINYGIPDLSVISIDENRVGGIAAYIRDALVEFEPRIIASTIEAVRDQSVSVSELQIRFIINAQLRCDPLDVPVEFVAEVDNDTCKFRIERL